MPAPAIRAASLTGASGITGVTGRLPGGISPKVMTSAAKLSANTYPALRPDKPLNIAAPSISLSATQFARKKTVLSAALTTTIARKTNARRATDPTNALAIFTPIAPTTPPPRTAKLAPMIAFGIAIQIESPLMRLTDNETAKPMLAVTFTSARVINPVGSPKATGLAFAYKYRCSETGSRRTPSNGSLLMKRPVEGS